MPGPQSDANYWMSQQVLDPFIESVFMSILDPLTQILTTFPDDFWLLLNQLTSDISNMLGHPS